MSKGAGRFWIIAAAVVIVGVGIFFFVRSRGSTVTTSFQTAEIVRGDLTAIIGATGTVKANQSAVLSWQTSGTVRDVAVSVGQKVSAGDTLAELDPASLSQSIILAQVDLVAAQRNLDNLKDSTTSLANAQLKVAQAQVALDDAKLARERLNYGNASQNVIEQRYAEYIIAQNSVDRLEDAYVFVEDRSETDPQRAALLSQLAAARQQRDRAWNNYQYAKSEPDPTDIAEAEAQVRLAQANLDDAQREAERVKNGVDPDDIAAAESRVAAAKASIRLANMTAPFAGTVTDVNAMAGDQVSAGTLAFRIDDLSHLFLDVQIGEVDIIRIQKGQPVDITFDAIGNQKYSGAVVEISRVGETTTSGINFKTTVEILDADEKVLPGMTAAVNITVKELKDVLIAPNRAFRTSDGKRVIYLLQDNAPKAVEVEIGESSDLNTQITSGEVQVGDIVILNPPTEFRPPAGGGPPGGGMRGQ